MGADGGTEHNNFLGISITVLEQFSHKMEWLCEPVLRVPSSKLLLRLSASSSFQPRPQS